MLAVSAPAGADQNTTESRVFGANRYGTAAQVALATYPAGSNSFILASGENFADGLAAAGLAGALDAPVLLTRQASLPLETQAALATLDGLLAGPATVRVLGGEAAISAGVRSQLTALGYTVVGIEGANRYATSAEIAEAAAAVTPVGAFGGRRTVIIANGTNESGGADALAAGTLASFGDHPILLTAPGALSPEVLAALDTINAEQAVIMGGEAAVSAEVEAALVAAGLTTIRVAGDNRFETAKALADILVAPAPAGLGWYDADDTTPATQDEVLIVNGLDWADALAAGPHGGKVKAPILLVRQCDIPAPTAEFHVTNAPAIDIVRAIGGPAAICEDVLDGAVAAATTATPTATVEALEGRTQGTIVFSEPIDTASFVAGEIQILRAGQAVVAINLAPVSPVLGAATTFTFDVDNTGPANVDRFVTGDVVTVPAGVALTPAPNPRGNATATTTVVDDTTRPTATILAPANSLTAFVTFSEPVDPTNAVDATNYTLGQGTGAAAPTLNGAITYSAATRTATLTFNAGLQVGNTIAVDAAATPPAGTDIVDLAGNGVVGTSVTVGADATRPTLQGATVTTTGVDKRTVDLVAGGGNNVVFEARTAGSAANAYTFTLVDQAGLVFPTVSISGTAITITYDVGVATNSQIATAFAASGANSVFVPAVEGVGGTLAPAAAPASLLNAPGTDTVTVVAQFSEAVRGYAEGDFTLAAGSSVLSPAVTPATTVAPNAPALSFNGQVTVTFAGVTVPNFAAPGTAEIRVVAAANTFEDLSGNDIVNTTRTLTAAS
jgi:putative cell wall-binding protein